MATTEERVEAVAYTLWFNAYEAEFGGKDRGRFLVSRNDLKGMLGVFRLHGTTISKLTDACGELGLVVIDMDDTFAFVEKNFVSKWRKLPSRLASEYANELEPDEDEVDAESDEEEEE